MGLPAGRRDDGRNGGALRPVQQRRAVQAIFQRYNEVSTMLAEQPHDYCPIFMIHTDEIVLAPWAAGFILGIALRQDAWATSILLTPDCSLLVPILFHHELGSRLIPDMLPAQPPPADAYHQIPAAVAAIRRVCNSHRAAEAVPAPRTARTRRRR
jgi:uncharacterized protein